MFLPCYALKMQPLVRYSCLEVFIWECVPTVCPALFFLGARDTAVSKTDQHLCLHKAYTSSRDTCCQEKAQEGNTDNGGVQSQRGWSGKAHREEGICWKDIKQDAFQTEADTLALECSRAVPSNISSVQYQVSFRKAQIPFLQGNFSYHSQDDIPPPHSYNYLSFMIPSSFVDTVLKNIH